MALHLEDLWLMAKNRYVRLIEDDTLVIGRRAAPSTYGEFLTQDDRYRDADGRPVRVTAGVAWGTGPDGTFQILQWDGRVSYPLGRGIEWSAPDSDPLLGLRRMMRAVERRTVEREHLPLPEYTASPAGVVAAAIGFALWQLHNPAVPKNGTT